MYPDVCEMALTKRLIAMTARWVESHMQGIPQGGGRVVLNLETIAVCRCATSDLQSGMILGLGCVSKRCR